VAGVAAGSPVATLCSRVELCEALRRRRVVPLCGPIWSEVGSKGAGVASQALRRRRVVPLCGPIWSEVGSKGAGVASQALRRRRVVPLCGPIWSEAGSKGARRSGTTDLSRRQWCHTRTQRTCLGANGAALGRNGLVSAPMVRRSDATDLSRRQWCHDRTQRTCLCATVPRSGVGLSVCLVAGVASPVATWRSSVEL
jgi:hypothetical protein